MKRKPFIFILAAVAIVAGLGTYSSLRKPGEIVLTGIVTTDAVIVSPQIPGRIEQLYVNVGDTVTNGQLLASLDAEALKADVDYFASSEQSASSQLSQAQSDLENVRLTFERIKGLYGDKVESIQAYDQARTAYDAAIARVEALKKQIESAQAQRKKAEVELGYTKIYAPTNGIVDTRVALQGEVINAGQAIVTLINPDDLWIRADVEETYIDGVRPGDQFTVRLPSGQERVGTVFHRGVDADYATQRDVSRTKRDIKTFEVRLRCDNSDRSLAVGMTAYVVLKLQK